MMPPRKSEPRGALHQRCRNRLAPWWLLGLILFWTLGAIHEEIGKRRRRARRLQQ